MERSIGINNPCQIGPEEKWFEKDSSPNGKSVRFEVRDAGELQNAAEWVVQTGLCEGSYTGRQIRLPYYKNEVTFEKALTRYNWLNSNRLTFH